MALEIKHVADLMGKHFKIPSFQRGYRWERKQIEQLLNDLDEFAQSLKEAKKLDQKNISDNSKNPHGIQKPTNNEQNIGYYCLQPLAVTNNGLSYDVIDGQQRLTTIYLILCYYSNQISSMMLPYNPSKKLGDELYSIEYETRDDAFFKNKLFTSTSDKSMDNIDFYFMSKGYQVIEDWFNNNSNKQSSLLKLLLPDDYDTKNHKYNSLLHDVRFIWYETPINKSIKTFTNLNYGKIGLTASELVKALLFECDRYEYAKRDIEKGVAFARSSKWSAMEESLQDSLFWGMLSPIQEGLDLHLELILSFVASDIDEKQQYSNKEGWNDTDEDWVFNIFNKAIVDVNLRDVNNNPLSTITQRVEYLWNSIQKVYTVFRNWYDDRSLYHKVGFFIFIATHYSKTKHKDVLRELYTSYSSKLKTVFETELNKRIGNVIRISAKIDDHKIDNKGDVVIYKRLKKLEELKYKEDDDAIRKILLLFNIEMTLLDKQTDSRFPFRLASSSEYDLKSLEHIHPQNLDDDAIRYIEFKKWFDDRTKILQSTGALSNPNNISLKDAVSNLKQNLVDEKTFISNKSACLSDLAEVDKKFDELAGMSPDVMHTLYNLALVDGPTNTALSNNLIDAKRQILIERTKNGETYVPLGTWYAFNKHFSKTVQDLKFWTKNDRDAYFAEIERVYNKYTK